MSLDGCPSDEALLRMKAERELERKFQQSDALIDRLSGPIDEPVRIHRAEPEHDEQVTLFAWAAMMETRYPELRWLFAVPNWIGTRTRHHGAYLKAEGRKPGVPDVWLPVSRAHYHGLVIEMKVKPNRPSDEQRAWLGHLESADYAVHVCYSAVEAECVILAYLNDDAPPKRAA